ncbi:MAG: 30S ribosomal protein S3 [Chloroflexi bacterium]|nr:30S ribosomal protein S3 [Chloroflexota bacterium]MCY3581067.1 30S ribosomal protein S3 [Chloroflexota bacterium]MCY3715256.1 30S ribosomal protein S3 [Chloroflexota bacterium]MDE2650027.1 30S ribosomal protein S3 [Chloroflexota bacterium]MXV93757.1 30S ribosomal protein S3 [Chloroflexota bacterium]
MGRKVHPKGFRLKVIREWDARWYAEGERFVNLLMEDRQIRKFIRQKTTRAGVSRIEIERQPNLVIITINTVRPGLIIGRKGEAVKELRQQLQDMTGKTVKVEVSEIDKPDLDAKLVADNVASQLVRRIGHSRAMKRAIMQAMRQGAGGIRIEVSGRLGGSDMARREWLFDGRVPRNTLRADIDYGFSEALTTFGQIGVKVWIYKGDILPGEDPFSTGAQRSSQPENRRRRN